MKKLLLLFIVGLLCSCQIHYDISTRLIVTGNITDKNASPLENRELKLWVYGENENDLISYTTTDAQGAFEMIIPKPHEGNEFRLIIPGDALYKGKEYVNIKHSNFEDYIFSMDQIYLFEPQDISQIDVTFNQVNPDNQVVNVYVEGLLADSTIWVNPQYTEDEYQPSYYTSFHQKVLKNQIIVLHYELYDNNTGTSTNFSETMQIDSQDLIEVTIDY